MIRKIIWGIMFSSLLIGTAVAQPKSGGKKISPDLFGLFFEDINYSADGGLYVELVQNGNVVRIASCTLLLAKNNFTHRIILSY